MSTYLIQFETFNVLNDNQKNQFSEKPHTPLY